MNYWTDRDDEREDEREEARDSYYQGHKPGMRYVGYGTYENESGNGSDLYDLGAGSVREM